MLRSMSFAICLAFGALAMPADADDMRPFVRGSWKSLVSAHSGQPIVVHFWGLTCHICMAELPEWGQLARENPHIRLVLVNWDRRPDRPDRLRATLAKAGLDKAESWVFAESFEEKLRFEIDPDWMGELPRTVMIAGDGTATAYSGAIDKEGMLAWQAKQAGR